MNNEILNLFPYLRDRIIITITFFYTFDKQYNYIYIKNMYKVIYIMYVCVFVKVCVCVFV